MAEIPVQNDVFKFLALRPPAKVKERTSESGKPRRIVDPRPLADTPVGKIIRDSGEHADIGQILPRVKELVTQMQWTPDIHRDDRLVVIGAVLQLLDEQLRDFSPQGFLDAMKEILDASPDKLVQTESARQDLWDRLHAFYLLNREAPVNLEEIMDGLRALHVVDLLANCEKFETVDDLRDALHTIVLLPDTLVRIAPAKPAARARDQEQARRDEIERGRLAGLWAQYVELNKAAEEIDRLQPTIVVEQSEPEAITHSPVQEDGSGADPAQQRAGQLFNVSLRRSATFARADIDALGVAARAAIDVASQEPGRFAKPEALDRIHRDLAFVTDQLFAINDPRLAELMPSEAMSLPAAITLKERNRFQPTLGLAGMPSPFPFPWFLKPRIRPLGIGDLKVVKQTLERYVAGEAAHIENVLQGESKERKHRRFDRSEEIVTIARESAEETERDTQTTDRFELKKESEKTIQTDMSIDAGITVSASYGPVEFGAYANFAYSQSTTDTSRTASNFARDVVDRSVTRIQKKTREERITKTIHEIEEINTHGLNNVAGAGHISGVYRWVDKHFKAQIFNYGKRMMFEFIVPEPAAFFIYAQGNNPAKKINLEEPKALGKLTHKDITESSYQNYIRDYRVQGVTPPPPASRILSMPFDQSGIQPNQTTSKSSRDLVVPDGYVARNWWGLWRGSVWAGHSFNFIVGTDSDFKGTLNREDMVVPVAIQTFNVAAYVATVEVYCQRTDRAYEEWQIKTFEKIMAAYQAAVAQYEDKLRAAEARRGVVITGQNPGINREIERTEMKKHCITTLTGERFQNFNSMSGSPPEIDLPDAAEEGRFIQFFEQAFEWEQMTYLFYPYFWGRKQNWATLSTTFDNDPLFTRFLQAGSARVVIPVHPAYNDAILYYLQTGELWNGGDPPVVDDPLYIALYEELKAQQDDLGGAVAEGDPWKVVLPTTLVWLQPGAELPDFTKT
ncbi:hypothetical protein [Massilia sp. CCM 8734]|uniref:hypothetical protein n=1 Tax=Massilia sp. CCM 8734 TaxID=2609283 RepID=UPI0014233A09|nr:hypothetical protein [Massilia sp. CCM 8734]NHZ95175.1 hypothetical protein [Massilia sp. CCM 8734]